MKTLVVTTYLDSMCPWENCVEQAQVFQMVILPVGVASLITRYTEIA